MPAQDWAQPGPEPLVEDMVQDPIVQLVMRRDRVTVAQIMATITEARLRLRSQRSNASTPVPVSAE